MKTLWVLNSPIGTAAQVLGYSHAASGTWIAAAETKLKRLIPDLRIDYVVMGYSDRSVTNDDLGCTVYEISVKQCRGRRAPTMDKCKWKQAIKSASPNLIHIWGTEFTNMLDVMDVSGDIPVAVTIQGVITSLAKYCKSDVPYKELMKGHSIIALPAYLRAKAKEREMIKQVSFEKEMLRRADAVLLDNGWSEAYCKINASKTEFVDFPLAINPVFETVKWDYDECTKNSIFTIAPSSSMKGAHVLLKAIAIVKENYPDVKLRIPGSIAGGRLAKIKEPPYFRYLRRLIKDLNLENNVEFCGKLTSEQMADELRMANVFVMPSKAENISTSLREAMWVGCPCVVSLVGAVHELVIHGENAMCYRYEEYEVMAHEIMKLLSDPVEAQRMAENGHKTIKEKYPMEQSLIHCAEWYQQATRRK